MQVIVQAGGKGTRLENFTRNKPKCLVSVKNRPLIFSVFNAFKNHPITVIADYKKEVLKDYLSVFGDQYRVRIIDAPGKGTASGISEAIKEMPESEPVIVVWCDLYFETDFSLPKNLITEELNTNFVGLSASFPCRWCFKNGEFVHEESSSEGVAGLFVFKNKKELMSVPTEGPLVPWLKKSGINFEPFYLESVTEVGTIKSFEEISRGQSGCRPFNQVVFNKDTVTKKGINSQGIQLGQIEVAWYKHVQPYGFGFLPKIFSFEPLVMERLKGKNVWEYNCLTYGNKLEILSKIIQALNELHNSCEIKPANDTDSLETYFDKTFKRLEKIQSLVPFAKDDFIKINGHYYKNILKCKEKIKNLVQSVLPSNFCLIHGDPTFSNTIYDRVNNKVFFIDPRGHFGDSYFFGDPDYDWAKLYYSLVGNYDQFNRKHFDLTIYSDKVELFILPNNWQDMEDFFFSSLNGVSKTKIKLLHALIWLSLTTYAWDDFDSICGAFYKGIIESQDFL